VKAKYVIATIAAALLALSAFAMDAKPEFLIKTRQSGYTFMAWNMGRIKAQLDAPAFNKDEVVSAANVIAAIANSGMGALYAKGTEKGQGWHETKVKGELFTDGEGVKKVAMSFNQEANEMAKVAASGDAAAVKAQFEKLGKSCKGCHEKFKIKEKE
jgi:cytochrome c556